MGEEAEYMIDRLMFPKEGFVDDLDDSVYCSLDLTICPQCGCRGEFKSATVIYGPSGKSYGKVLVCVNHPRCDSYVGVHKSGRYRDLPKGTMADFKTRNARKRAHEAFDLLWKDKKSRGIAYEWLSDLMNLPAYSAHIGLMNAEQCEKVVRAVELRLGSSARQIRARRDFA